MSLPVLPARAASLLALCLVLAAPAPAPAAGGAPERITVLAAHAAGGRDDALTRALAEAWDRRLGIPVTVKALGRGTALRAVAEFVRAPRDGTVVLAGDLGRLALAYGEARPAWIWERTLEHLGAFALDPVRLVAAGAKGPEGMAEVTSVAAAARAAPVTIGIGGWGSLDHLVLLDAAAQAGLAFAVVPVDAGPGLARALAEGELGLAFARRSALKGIGRDLTVLAAAPLPGGGLPGGAPALDAALGTVTAPAGGVAVISVHADFQRAFPARYERLKRGLAAALEDEAYGEALDALGLTAAGAARLDHPPLMAALRRWWDLARRAGAGVGPPPAAVATRGKLTRVEAGGRALGYLGLDGKIHDLAADPEATELLVGGAAVTAPAPLAALKEGMLCEITWPSPLALEASKLACK